MKFARDAMRTGLAIAATIALCACGIQPKGGAPGDGSADERVEAPIDATGCAAFAPQSVRIHPLTRLARDKNDGVSVQAHVELVDAWGDSVKWLGVMVFELYRDAYSGSGGGTGAGGVAGGQEQVNRWSLDLTDASANASAYDRVTRTYRATLTDVGVPLRARQNLTLRATFNTADGRQLTTTFRIAAE